ncbi:MAG: phosphatidylinositol-3-phosphatase, partial [Ilumatobacteraceae bacterium]
LTVPAASAAPSPSSTTPCGITTTPPQQYDHVIWLIFENQRYSSVIGSTAAPYLTGLAAECGNAKGMVAETHPSLPNYLWMSAGSSKGVTDDGPPSAHPLKGPTIFSVIGNWRSLHESMPSNCLKSNSGGYAVRHNPAAYFIDLPSCAVRDVPLTATPDLSAKFTMIVPNLCHSMHDCTVATGDTWASGFVRKLLDSAEYKAGRTAIFITFDESDTTASNRIPTIVIAPSVKPGTVVTTTYNHCNLQHTSIKMLLAPGPYSWAGCPSAATMRFNLL